MKVRFIKEKIVTENGNEFVKKEELIEECLKNASYSVKIIEIIKYVLEIWGYELDESNYNYRKSILFNELEKIIVHSEEYQESKEKKVPIQSKKSVADLYLAEKLGKEKMGAISYAARRPRRFSHKSY